MSVLGPSNVKAKYLCGVDGRGAGQENVENSAKTCASLLRKALAYAFPLASSLSKGQHIGRVWPRKAEPFTPLLPPSLETSHIHVWMFPFNRRQAQGFLAF